MLLLPTMLSDLPFSKPQRIYLADLLPLPGWPTLRHLARFGDRGPHTRAPGGPAPRLCGPQFGVAVRGGAVCARPGPVGDSTFIPKSSRKLPGGGYRWHGGEGRVAWG